MASNWKELIAVREKLVEAAAVIWDHLKLAAGVPAVCPECGRSLDVKVMYVRGADEQMHPVMNAQCNHVPTCLWAKDYPLPE